MQNLFFTQAFYTHLDYYFFCCVNDLNGTNKFTIIESIKYNNVLLNVLQKINLYKIRLREHHNELDALQLLFHSKLIMCPITTFTTPLTTNTSSLSTCWIVIPIPLRQIWSALFLPFLPTSLSLYE